MRARSRISTETHAGWEITFYRSSTSGRAVGEKPWEAYIVEEDASFVGDSRADVRAKAVDFIETVLGRHPYDNVQVIVAGGE